MNDNSVLDLHCFIKDAIQDVDFMIENLIILKGTLKGIYPILNKAWAETKNQRDAIDLFFKEHAKDEKFLKWLEMHGLTGFQLQLKITVYQMERKRFIKAYEIYKPLLKRAPGKKWYSLRGTFRKQAKKLLSVIDKIFDSLRDIPGTGVVREIKGIIEELL